MRCVHYVGFRDDAYLRALRVFGGPAFIHRWWDRRAAREIGPGDLEAVPGFVWGRDGG
jgi:hypothetical protein